MFSRSADLYDKIYQSHRKNYEDECQRILNIVREYTARPSQSLLDVACGTGVHLALLSPAFTEARGIDLDTDMVRIARAKLPSCTLHEGDMIDFDLRRTFDVVTCLFSSIGYVRTVDNLHRAVANMVKHTAPGGIVLVEPWFTPDAIEEGHLHAVFIDEPDLKIARMSDLRIVDRLTVLDFHYLVSTRDGVEHFTERHELGVFTVDEHLDAFRSAGLVAEYDETGLMHRGLYIARRES